jgi:putative DNA primase/helicase
MEIRKFAEDNNICIIPIEPKGKKPLVDWKIYQKRKPSKEELDKWFEEKDINFAFVCGEISGNLVVIDFDNPEFYEYIRRVLPETTIVKTSKGFHAYFRVGRKTTKTRIEIFKESNRIGNVDIQAEGSYVVAPNSIHPSGSVYTIINDKPPYKFTGDIKQWIYDNIEKAAKENEWKLHGFKNEPIDIDKILQGITSGSRNEYGIKLATWYRKKGTTKEETLRLCHEWNAKNKPPLKDTEIRTIIDSAYSPQKPYNYIFRKGANEGTCFNERNTFVPKLLGDMIMNDFIFKSIPKNGIYVYDDGIYKPHGETLIKEIANRSLGEWTRKNHINETLAYIEHSTYIHEGDIPLENDTINVLNGVYHTPSGKLLQHDPNEFETTQIPITYDPKAECPKSLKFIKEILKPEDIPIIQELMGYCLYKKYNIQKAFMLVGDGANGKSTFLNLLKTFLGPKNISGVSLQDFDKNRFSSAILHGKLANLNNDVSDIALYSTGKFKMLSGGDSIEADKKFCDSFQFVNYAKLIFACNKLPETKDESGAFYRRWVIVNFPNKFEGDNCDPDILDKLIVPEEMSGLFNWALEGLNRLLENKKFSYSRTTEETRNFYERAASPINAFVKDCLKEKTDKIVTKEEIYQGFIEYCLKFGLPSVDKAVFGKKISQYIKVSSTRKRIDGERKHCWQGIEYTKYNTEITKAREDMGQGVQVDAISYSLKDSKYIYKDRLNSSASLDCLVTPVRIIANRILQKLTSEKKLSDIKTYMKFEKSMSKIDDFDNLFDMVIEQMKQEGKIYEPHVGYVAKVK